jgi:hypothetical protein
LREGGGAVKTLLKGTPSDNGRRSSDLVIIRFISANFIGLYRRPLWNYKDPGNAIIPVQQRLLSKKSRGGGVAFKALNYWPDIFFIMSQPRESRPERGSLTVEGLRFKTREKWRRISREVSVLG